MRRLLAAEEIRMLEVQGCTFGPNSTVEVDEDFDISLIRHTHFSGTVSIGKNVSLNHVGEIGNSWLGDNVTVCRVNELVSDKNITNELFNEGITVGNEAGEPNIRFSLHSNERIDWLGIHYPHLLSTEKEEASENPSLCTIGNHCVIKNSGVVRNVIIHSSVTVDGAAHLENGILHEESCIGAQVIARTFSIGPRTRVTDGAKLYHVITTNDCKIGKGFMAENCYFSHHCELFCGEACAIFAGPHTVSHHKSTLLIGGEFSFYNAGSNTNQSNHAYKLGPIHYGTLSRGSKTASGCHILWPMQTAPFTMVMGKVKTHPDLSSLPFSYVIAEGENVYVAPGVNLGTAGTFRDVSKWKQRGKSDYIGEYDFLSPWVMQTVFKGIRILKKLQQEQGTETEEYTYNGVSIRRHALLRGIDRYELAIRLFAGKITSTGNIHHNEADKWHWIDAAGLPLVLEFLAGNIRRLDNPSDTVAINQEYKEQMQQWGMAMLVRHYNTEFSFEKIQESARQALSEWKALVVADAHKEYGLGDMKKELLSDFIRKVEATDHNIF